MSQQNLAITPSPEALEIDAAHKVLRDAIGTPQEAVARKYLEIVVAKINTLSLFAEAMSYGSTDAQCTPRNLALDLGPFDLDVCSNPRSHIQATRSYMLERGQDGLALPWAGSVWCNGPYSNPLPWCERLRAHDAPWCSLWKCDTTTAWFRQLVDGGASWAPFRQRLRFERPGNCGSADFTSLLVWRDWNPSDAVAARLWIREAA